MPRSFLVKKTSRSKARSKRCRKADDVTIAPAYIAPSSTDQLVASTVLPDSTNGSSPLLSSVSPQSVTSYSPSCTPTSSQQSPAMQPQSSPPPLMTSYGSLAAAATSYTGTWDIIGGKEASLGNAEVGRWITDSPLAATSPPPPPAHGHAGEVTSRRIPATSVTQEADGSMLLLHPLSVQVADSGYNKDIKKVSAFYSSADPLGNARNDEPTIKREASEKLTSPRATVGYTYDAFFVSDGRSRKKKNAGFSSTSQSPASSSSHPSKQRYACNECGKQYATSSNLSRHKQTHRSLDSKLAKQCPHCDKRYVSMPALSMHILTHNLRHKCTVCNKSFSRPWLLQGHLRSHSGEKPYGCAHCGKAFADRSNLRAHMQTHSVMKHYRCKRCSKSFALKSYLNKHHESACFKDLDSPEAMTSSSAELSSPRSSSSCSPPPPSTSPPRERPSPHSLMTSSPTSAVTSLNSYGLEQFSKYATEPPLSLVSNRFNYDQGLHSALSSQQQ